jgi:hypothetical protein
LKRKFFVRWAGTSGNKGRNPVFFTKNGRGKYVLLDMDDYEKTQAGNKLVAELVKG